MLQVFDWDYITSNDEIGEVQVIHKFGGYLSKPMQWYSLVW